MIDSKHVRRGRSQCPEPEILADLVLGKLPDDKLTQTIEHVERCSPCGDTVQGLQLSDTWQDLARAGFSPEDSGAEAGRAALEGERSQTRSRDNSGDAFNAESQLVARLIQNNLDRQELIERGVGSKSGNSFDGIGGLSSRAAEVLQVLPEGDEGTLGQLASYRIQELIGVGATGVVFRAVDDDLDRPVALKILRPSLGPLARERFIAEARAAAAVEHENVVTIYQVGVDAELAFIAMQWLPGQTLESALKERVAVDASKEGAAGSELPMAGLPIDDVVWIGRQIAAGLDAAHSKGLIHRDIKPANIWLDQENRRAKLLDFGLVRAVDEPSITETGLIAGTPGYMSPEQSRGQELDSRSDLFGLGCLLYEAATGRPPFAATNVLGTLYGIQHHHPPTPHSINPDIPEGLNDLILCLLEKNRNDRPAAAADVVSAIGKPRSEWGFKWQAKKKTARSAEPQTSASESGGRSRTLRWLIAAALLPLFALAMALAGPQVIRIVTDQGVLEIRSDDPDLQVKVEQNGEVIEVIDLKTRQKIEIKSGEYHIVPVSNENGISVSANKVIMTRGGHQIVEIERLDPASGNGDGESGPTGELAGGDTMIGSYRLKHVNPSRLLQDYQAALRDFPGLQLQSGQGGLLTATGPPKQLARFFKFVKDEVDLPENEVRTYLGKSRQQYMQIVRREVEPGARLDAFEAIGSLSQNTEEFSEAWRLAEDLVDKLGAEDVLLNLFFQADPDLAVSYTVRQLGEEAGRGRDFIHAALLRMNYRDDVPAELKARFGEQREKIFDAALSWLESAPNSRDAQSTVSLLLSNPQLQPNWQMRMENSLEPIVLNSDIAFWFRLSVVQYVLSKKQRKLAATWSAALNPAAGSDNYEQLLAFAESLLAQQPDELPVVLNLLEKLLVDFQVDRLTPLGTRVGMLGEYDARVLRVLLQLELDARDSRSLVQILDAKLQARAKGTQQIFQDVSFPEELKDRLPYGTMVEACKLYEELRKKLLDNVPEYRDWLAILEDIDSSKDVQSFDSALQRFVESTYRAKQTGDGETMDEVQAVLRIFVARWKFQQVPKTTNQCIQQVLQRMSPEELVAAASRLIVHGTSERESLSTLFSLWLEDESPAGMEYKAAFQNAGPELCQLLLQRAKGETYRQGRDWVGQSLFQLVARFEPALSDKAQAEVISFWRGRVLRVVKRHRRRRLRWRLCCTVAKLAIS